MCVEARSGSPLRVVLHEPLTLSFGTVFPWNTGLSDLWGSLTRLSWLWSVNPGDPLVSGSLELKYRSRILYPAFTMGSGTNLRFQACSASTLPAETSPQPCN